ncbi:MAG: hypothetical protein FWF24_03820 [Alphaproteobacteria bacterium]|nr:hypothetical protein [Alphaproteobacteria bacterium]
MLHIRFCLLALLGFLFLLPSLAQAQCNPRQQTCIGQSCERDKVGTTAMDYNLKSILACLIDADGQSRWLPASLRNMQCNPGKMMIGINNNEPVCVDLPNMTPNMTCASSDQAMQGIMDGQPICATVPGGLTNASSEGLAYTVRQTGGNERTCLIPHAVSLICGCPPGQTSVKVATDSPTPGTSYIIYRCYATNPH